MVLNGGNDLSRFNENFIKSYYQNSDVGYFLEVDIECSKKIMELS